MEPLRGWTYSFHCCQTSHPLSPLPSYPVSVVLEYLEEQKLSEYSEVFRRHGIDGDLLQEANDAVLKELGVNNALHRVKIRTKFKSFVSRQRITTL